MGKEQLTLYVNGELKEIAKARGFNISQYLNNLLALEFTDDEDIKSGDILLNLKSRISLLSGELKEKTKECEKLRKEIKEIKEIKEKGAKKDNGNDYIPLEPL